MDKKILEFYNNIVNLPFGDNEGATRLKKQVFSTILNNNLLYKYISFTLDDILNNKKLLAIRENKLWFAAHYVLRDNDATEFKIYANTKRISECTGASIETIESLLGTLRELNDLCCLSNQYNEYMWTNYANNHSGCCCVFEVKNYEMLWPVIYCDKIKTDFTEEMVQLIQNPNLGNLAINKIAFISPVLKDKIKYGQEQEVRLLCGDIYDSESDALGGKIMADKKEALHYTGTYYPYNKCGLSLRKIIIGKNTNAMITNELNSFELGIPVEME